MTAEWAQAKAVAKPWGKIDLRPWSELGRPGEAVGEIQQNGDTTFRLFDHRRPRPLHIDESLAAAHAGPAQPQSPMRRLSPSRTLLMEQPGFLAEKLDLTPASRWCLRAEQETWLLVMGGSARCAQRAAGFGDVLLVEADATEIRLGAEGLQALVAYPAPLQACLLEEAEPAEPATSHPPPAADRQHHAPGAMA